MLEVAFEASDKAEGEVVLVGSGFPVGILILRSMRNDFVVAKRQLPLPSHARVDVGVDEEGTVGLALSEQFEEFVRRKPSVRIAVEFPTQIVVSSYALCPSRRHCTTPTYQE